MALLKIPNLNTVSPLIDRLCIENVKLAHFKFQIENNDKVEIQGLESKIKTQKEIISLIKDELTELLDEIISQGRYDYVDENRTFS